jgi:AcrR family transcriptional regulator
MSALGGGRTRTKRSTATKEQIVEAAASLLATKGYEATSLDDVAAAAGITKGTVYYHFDSKEALYWAVVAPNVAKTVLRAEDAVARNPSPRDAIIEVVMLLTRGARESNEKYMYYQEMLPLNDEMRRAIREQERRYEALVADVIRRGQDAGEMMPGDPHILSLILIGAAARTARWYDPSGQVPPGDFWQMFAGLVLNGLLVRDWVLGNESPAALASVRPRS